MIYTEHTPLLTPPAPSDPDRVADLVLARPHGAYTEHDVRSILLCYAVACLPLGLDPYLPIAQMLHETGWLSSFWAARPRRNPAGIGVNGQKQADEPRDRANWAYNDQRGQWERGVSFASWKDDAISAHLGRLLAYALAPRQGTPAQREMIAKALSYRTLPIQLRGSAPTLRQLGRVHNPTGQGWSSPGADYGARIAAIANRLRSDT